ncbi:MAG: AraC family transcriptional regulator [Amphritea sp.]
MEGWYSDNPAVPTPTGISRITDYSARLTIDGDYFDVKRNLISNHYLQAFICGAARMGHSQHELLRRAGIPYELLGMPNARVTEEQVIRLVKTVWRVTGDEFMGLTGQRCNNGVFALMAESVLHTQTLGGMLQQSTRFYKTVRDDLEVGLRHYDEFLDVTLSLKDQTLDSDHMLQEFILLMWQRFSCWLVDQQVPIVSTWFNYPAPAHLDEYRLMFSGQLQFDQPFSGFTLSKKLLRLPLVRERQELQQFLADSPAGILRRPRQDDTYQIQVRRLLLQHGLGSLPTLDAMAKELYMTTRTLSRKLKEEGSNYQLIKDQLRCDTAIQLLARENMSIAEVSRLTGFTEQAAFCRAFKSWTGTVPSAYEKIV